MEGQRSGATAFVGCPERGAHQFGEYPIEHVASRGPHEVVPEVASGVGKVPDSALVLAPDVLQARVPYVERLSELVATQETHQVELVDGASQGFPGGTDTGQTASKGVALVEVVAVEGDGPLHEVDDLVDVHELGLGGHRQGIKKVPTVIEFTG